MSVEIMSAIEEQVRRIAACLNETQTRLAVAESCTGGGVAYALTALPGSSDWFERGWVTYSNEAKQDCLGVSQALLESHGAVSEQVAKAMAEGALQAANVDHALSITGIAGPGGATKDKPVGMVCFAYASAKECLVFTQHFEGDRVAVREQAILYALERIGSDKPISPA